MTAPDLLSDARREAALGAIPPDLADRLIDEVERLRAETVALAEALEHVAGIGTVVVDGLTMWVADAECADPRGRICHVDFSTSLDEWCPVCIAEVAWCAWKLGVMS